jgi:hypothetical protein
MKKTIAATVVLIFMLMPLSAQKKKDVLYLKNGSTIYGRLIEASDSQYKIKTADGSLFIYSTREVEKFINETPYFEGRKKKGLGFSLEAGMLIGSQNTNYRAPFSFNILGSYTVSTKNIFSLGSGVEYLGEPFNPLFLEYKHIMQDKKNVPFIFIRGGRLMHLKDDSKNSGYYYSSYDYSKDYKGGLSLTIGTGISWVKEDYETYLSFAYRYAHTSYTQNNYNNFAETYQSSYNRLEIKFGYKF